MLVLWNKTKWQSRIITHERIHPGINLPGCILDLHETLSQSFCGLETGTEDRRF